MGFRNKKVYGQSKEENCFFCDKKAFFKNKQGLNACADHKTSFSDEKPCVCGEKLSVKQSKWGPFFLCPNCGPISQKKAEEMEADEGYNINKKYKTPKKRVVYEKDRVYTLSELEELWD
ncbi:hypothetical protein GOV05_02820 [Candidatus Woesearchaeota archaeon]|nr:hypothetical protein [Candidatus Woesearchaeota archaeon]